MTIIEAQGLKKTFQSSLRREGRFGTFISLFKPLSKEVVAVDDVTFAIEKGESVAYLGPNGAGKSTTIKMLTGILVPTQGEIRVVNSIPYKNRIQNSYHVGAVFGQRSQLLFDLPVRDSYELLRHMYGISLSRYQENLKRFTEILEIGDLLVRPVRTLSLGQRMRCEILAALLHDPEILFLDEPTIGLDVIAKERIRNFIAAINREKGVTVLLTTHDLGDIERLCPRLIIIDKGRLIYDGGIEYIKDRFATERQIRIVMPDPAAAVQLKNRLSDKPGLEVALAAQSVRITYNPHRIDTAELLRQVLADPPDLSGRARRSAPPDQRRGGLK
jgi:ABC-2 type transport system ATP-binding protein